MSIQSNLAEINVTPLVDVMLVLLIVFMISAPLMQHGVQVNLPKTEAGSLDDTPDQIDLVIKPGKRGPAILVNGKRIKSGQLLSQLQGITASNPKIPVFVKADKEVPYGTVAQVIAIVKKANISRVGLVTEPGGGKSSI